eukprot:413730_1
MQATETSMIGDTDNNMNNNDDDRKEIDFASQEEYLRSFLTKQTTALPPKPEKALSIGFFINTKKNIRISVDVNMTFWDLLGELDVHQPSNIQDLELHISQNPEPLNKHIVITNDWMNRTFWE